jgi:glycosyltransferase involved in cell wall biosynthesis
MKNYAFLLLSNTVFGGAQRRFIHLFLYLKKQYPDKGIFIMTPAMKKEMKALYGDEAIRDVVTVGKIIETGSINKNKTENSGERGKTKRKGFLKNNFLYKWYYFRKTRKAQKALFEEINVLTNKHQIESFLAIYTGILPLYFYFNSGKPRPKIIFVNMDSWFSHLSVNPKKDWFKQYDLFNRAHIESDRIDILSPFILEGLRKRNIKINETLCSITPCSFTDYSRCKISEKKNIDFIFASRLEADKNPLMYIEASAKLAKSYPHSKFIIAGDGRQSIQIKTRLSELGIPNIIYMGFVPHITELMSETSVFVSLQKENNYPSQAVLEAMACGNAIIATNVGDTHLFVNEKTGWLIPNGTEALTNTMKHCLENPEEIKSKGAYAAVYVRDNFSIERAAAYYQKILNDEE